jgi:hypothetical protein
MTWQAVGTIPIRIDTAISAARAEAVRAALLARTLPLARLVHGRAEPLATASLVTTGGTLAILTAAHIFDHVCAGDLVLPLPREQGWLALRSVRLRVIIHPERDLAMLHIDDSALARRLRANWMPVPAAHLDFDSLQGTAGVYAVAGYPVSQSRRIEGSIVMKPVVVFTSALDAERLAYARTAERIDGVSIHTPELDGVSGALVWAVFDDGPELGCRLQAAAVQVAFAHGRYVRTEPLRAAPALFAYLR